MPTKHRCTVIILKKRSEKEQGKKITHLNGNTINVPYVARTEAMLPANNTVITPTTDNAHETTLELVNSAMANNARIKKIVDANLSENRATQERRKTGCEIIIF